MKITDRQGNEFEVVRGEVPERDFNIGRKEFAEAVSARFATDANECQCQTLEDVLTETGLPNLLVSTPEGTQRVYAVQRGALALALERPNADFYASQEAAAAAEEVNAMETLTEAEATIVSLTAEADAATDVKALMAFMLAGKHEALTQAEKVRDEAQARITQARTAKAWNGKAKAVADGVKCMCKISKEVVG